jgi:hypothetical protein
MLYCNVVHINYGLIRVKNCRYCKRLLNTLEGILSDLGDFTQGPTNAIEQTGSGAIDDSTPTPVPPIEVNDTTSNEATPTQAFTIPDFFSF